MSKQFLTTQDLMEKYQVAQTTIYRWRKQGMPFRKIGRAVRFDENDVELWLNNNKS